MYLCVQDGCAMSPAYCSRCCISPIMEVLPERMIFQIGHKPLETKDHISSRIVLPAYHCPPAVQHSARQIAATTAYSTCAHSRACCTPGNNAAAFAYMLLSILISSSRCIPQALRNLPHLQTHQPAQQLAATLYWNNSTTEYVLPHDPPTWQCQHNTQS